jgi:hypothetical protein
MKATNTASPVDALQTTGRGGTGNIAKNDLENPEICKEEPGR